MKPTFRQRFQYQFDNLMSRGTPAMIGMLFVFSLIIVIIAGAVISVTGFVQEGRRAIKFRGSHVGKPDAHA